MSRHRLETALVEVSPSLLAYLERRVGPDDAPDLLGETMVIAWRREGDLPEDPDSIRPWLFGIARGTLMNHARGQRRRWALADRIRRENPPPAAPGADAGIDVRDAIARLQPDLAELVRLLHWEGITIVDAATVLGISASTARTRYQRAREALRTALQEPATRLIELEPKPQS